MLIDRLVYIYCYLHLLIPLINFTLADCTLFQEETRLIRRLLNESTYLKRVRPSQEVVVDIRFVFNQIISMVEKEQIIVTNCFVDQKWTGTENKTIEFFFQIKIFKKQNLQIHDLFGIQSNLKI
ncbi:unnamed protein product [Rotaria magnacalcarata]|uniref:Neurotransmitter-gated ion-channel ligand-binding domain-containing protein n=1 Tax=Rotaria magnacalcarata TaxID=392030 RepID=A0A8S3FJK6_9BILA|nr:unnamed protein product [Rotaria magnacalcarata]